VFIRVYPWLKTGLVVERISNESPGWNVFNQNPIGPMKKLLAVFIIAALATAAGRAQDWAKARLDKTPRHLEWIKIKSGEREVDCSIAFPETKDKATAVIVIHEIFGLTDWVRSVTDQLAEAGYIAIAPDFLSGKAGARGGDGARGAIGSVPADQITADLKAAMDYVSKLPACNGKVVVAGFCWGGTQTFRFATNNKDIKAGFVFYGQSPNEADMARVNCPIYGFYGGNDARITAAVPATSEQMKKAGKTYEPVTYEGAGHGFMRAGEDPAGTAPNKKAREESWTRWKELLKKI
jgi:carboxymethylenebutenolidase